MPPSKPLRFRKLDDGWWRAFRAEQIYDLYRDEALNQYRTLVRGRGDRILAEATFDLARRGAWTQAKAFLEADGNVPGYRRKAVA